VLRRLAVRVVHGSRDGACWLPINSQVAGGTDTDVSCDNGGPTFNTTDSTGDGTATASNLEPVVITCTINIDP
jgi:hypothetical protein